MLGLEPQPHSAPSLPPSHQLGSVSMVRICMWLPRMDRPEPFSNISPQRDSIQLPSDLEQIYFLSGMGLISGVPRALAGANLMFIPPQEEPHHSPLSPLASLVYRLDLLMTEPMSGLRSQGDPLMLTMLRREQTLQSHPSQAHLNNAVSMGITSG